jgi:hypothetical protein
MANAQIEGVTTTAISVRWCTNDMRKKGLGCLIRPSEVPLRAMKAKQLADALLTVRVAGGP